MALGPGDRLGPYEVTALLGEGGMGHVWRARHTGLKREDALKVLPDTFTSDPERVARFQREAELLASLNHPHIAAIYGIEASDGVQALVLELVEGPTLADRIAEGAIAVPEALAIAKQVAEALEAAHEQGIIHRDLKPANIKVKPDGSVKVLDFGLAKALNPPAASGVSNASKSPTITSPAMTLAGMILGTAAYMSPEQARGKRVDRRSDVWAFGCVLYEMLTGQRAFPGDDVSDTFVAVLAHEPNWQALPAATPLRIRALVERCVKKDPRRRLPDIAAARIEIEEVQSEPETPVRPAAPASDRFKYVGWVLALIFLLTTAGLAIQRLRQPVVDAPTVRFEVVPPQVGQVGDPQLSPDGRKLAYVASGDGKRLIWIHHFDTAAAQPVTSTVGAARVFWSADSEYVGFISDGRLKKVPITGGPAQVVSNLPSAAISDPTLRQPTNYSGTWSQDGVILLAVPGEGSIMMVPAAGGQLTPISQLDPARKERAHLFPSFLPDGRHYLFYAASLDPANSTAFIGTLGSSERRPLSGITSQVKYSPTGYLLFIRDGALMAQRFDASRLEQTGEAFPVVDPFSESSIAAPFSVSLRTDLAFAVSSGRSSQLAWFDRTGKQLSTVGPPGDYQQAALSPNDRLVAFQRGVGAQPDIWVLDLERGVTSPVNSDPGRDTSPVWSPDSKTIAFDSTREGRRGLYERTFGMVGEDKFLLRAGVRNLSDWSRDGRYLAYEDGTNIWAVSLPVAEGTTPQRITEESAFAKANPKISPDGRWIAYDSSESREGADVYIQSFPKPGLKLQVSRAGGTQPNWSHDGKELFYMASDSTLMAVSIKPSGSSLELGIPVPLFQPRFDVLPFRAYSVSGNGRFLISIPSGQSAPITVILNWAAGLKK